MKINHNKEKVLRMEVEKQDKNNKLKLREVRVERGITVTKTRSSEIDAFLW